MQVEHKHSSTSDSIQTVTTSAALSISPLTNQPSNHTLRALGSALEAVPPQTCTASCRRHCRARDLRAVARCALPVCFNSNRKIFLQNPGGIPAPCSRGTMLFQASGCNAKRGALFHAFTVKTDEAWLPPG